MQAPGSLGNLEPLRRAIEGPYTPATRKTVEEEAERLRSVYPDEKLDELIQALLLARRRDVSVSASSPLYMHVVVAEATFKYSLVVAANTCVDDFVRELVNSLNLPTRGPQGQVISYRLATREKSGRYRVLLRRPTLFEQEIEPGCDLVLLPDVSS